MPGLQLMWLLGHLLVISTNIIKRQRHAINVDWLLSINSVFGDLNAPSWLFSMSVVFVVEMGLKLLSFGNLRGIIWILNEIKTIWEISAIAFIWLTNYVEWGRKSTAFSWSKYFNYSLKPFIKDERSKTQWIQRIVYYLQIKLQPCNIKKHKIKNLNP